MKGTNCYTAGAVVYVMTGLLHGVAHFQPPPTEPSHVEARRAMAGAVQTIAGMSFSFADALHCLSWFMTVFSVLTGVLALALRRACRSDPRLLRTASVVLGLGAAVLAALAWGHGVFPPLVLYALATVLFGAAAVRAARSC